MGSPISTPTFQAKAANIFNADGITQFYTEGTWTPVITPSGTGTITSYTINSAKYIRIGNRCFFSANFTITDKGTATGGWKMTMPLTVLEEEAICIACPTDGFSYSGFTVVSGSTSICYKYDGGSSITNARFVVSGNYRIS